MSTESFLVSRNAEPTYALWIWSIDAKHIGVWCQISPSQREA